MEALSYYQRDEVVLPGPLRGVGVALVVLVVVLAGLPVAMVLDPGTYTEPLVRGDPSVAPADLDAAITTMIAWTAILHALYAVVAVWLVGKCLTGRRWARIALTAVMVAATLSSVDSAQASLEYFWWAIAGDVLHVAIIALLWLPASVRRFLRDRA